MNDVVLDICWRLNEARGRLQGPSVAEAVGMVGWVALKGWWVTGGGVLIGRWCGLYGLY